MTPTTTSPSLVPTKSSDIDVITTVAGTGSASYSGDNGASTSASFNYPFGVSLDSSGK